MMIMIQFDASTYLLVTVNYTVQAKSLIVSKRAMARLLPKLVTSSEATPWFFIYFMQVQKPADSVFVHAAMSVLPNKKSISLRFSHLYR